jgi:hypothetical protein
MAASMKFCTAGLEAVAVAVFPSSGDSSAARQQCLNFFPLPHSHGALWLSFGWDIQNRQGQKNMNGFRNSRRSLQVMQRC